MAVSPRLSIVVIVVLLSACLGLPDGVQPVGGFEEERYLGKWYEIARLDHSFERGLSKVSAEYSLRDDGGIRVINRGYSADEQDWQQAEGKAYFVGERDVGHLKVSFFGPFYGTYAVFELDRENYQYAFIAGNNTSYLWLLARTPTISDALKDQFISSVTALGFDSSQLIFVEQD